MIKCFWCGAANDGGVSVCENCKRDLQWSRFFRAVLRPSVGCLLGNGAMEMAKAAATATAVRT